jgi:hypothetical protein
MSKARASSRMPRSPSASIPAPRILGATQTVGQPGSQERGDYPGSPFHQHRANAPLVQCRQQGDQVYASCGVGRQAQYGGAEGTNLIALGGGRTVGHGEDGAGCGSLREYGCGERRAQGAIDHDTQRITARGASYRQTRIVLADRADADHDRVVLGA